MTIKNFAVFCGSSAGVDPIYLNKAAEVGKALAEKERTVIYGGAQVGCMGALADTTLDNGGRVVGVIPKKLRDVEIAHNTLNELHVVEDMHERKAKMASLADGFIALPGGTGTLEEWFEVFTWSQLGYHQKPCGLLNVNGFFDPLLAMLDHTVEQGFMKAAYRDMMIVADEPTELLTAMDAYEPKHLVKWT